MMTLNQGGKFEIMLPFLSLITEESESRTYVFYLPKKLAFCAPSSGQGQWQGPRESPLWKSLTCHIQGLLYRIAHKGVKDCGRIFCEATELLLALSPGHRFYILFVTLASLSGALAQWNTRNRRKRNNGNNWTIPFGLLTLWPGWCLHKNRNITWKPGFSGEDESGSLGKGKDALSFVWFWFQHFASVAK